MGDSKLKLLILEDVLPDMELTVWHLTEAGYQLDVTHVDNELAYSEALRKYTFDIIISDFNLPGFDAFGALEICQKTCPEVPFICVSGTIGEETAVELIKKGAIDYVLKDRPARLPFTVQRALDEAKEKAAHRKAEEELRDSEIQLKAVFEHSNDGILLIDNHGVIVKTNHQTELTTGLYKDKLIGSFFWEIQYQLLLPELKQSLSKMDLKEISLKRLITLADDEFIKQESTILNARNEIKYVEDFVRPIHIHNKRYYLVSQRDITERKKADEALKESESFLKSTIDGLSAHIVVLNENGTIILTNKAYRDFAEQNKAKPDTVEVGKNYLTVCDTSSGDYSEEAFPFAEGIREVLSDKREYFEMEYPCHSPEEDRWFVGRVTKMKGDGPRKVIVAHENITKSKQAEKLLIQSEQDLLRKNLDYEALNEELTEVNSKLLLAKEKAEANNAINLSRLHLIQYSYNHSIDELLEETVNISEKHTKSNIGFIHFVASDQQNLILQNWSTQTKYNFCNIKGQGEHYSIDKAGVWVDCVRQRKPVIHNDYNALPHKKGLPEGHAHIEREMVVPVFTGNVIKAILGVGNKQTDYTKDDLEELSLIANLTWEIVERKIAHNELKIAKERAEESDKLKTAFIQNISHEIRTPLNGILGFAELITESDLSEEERSIYLEHINQSSNRLMNTVSDYMDMARLVSNSIQVNKKVFALEPFFAGVTEKTKLACSAKKVKFEMEVPIETSGLTVYSDPVFIQIILNKLLDNATKFTKEGTVTCGYSIKQEHIEFFVRDTGIGIDNNKLDLIFEMFRQADNSTTRGHDGSGLGLTIAKGLVTILGGQIYASSGKEIGSVFTFTIPINNAEKNISPDQIIITKKEIPKNPIIMIAEDEESNYEYLAFTLNKIGFFHIRVGNGAEAVEVCRQNPEISLVLMDIKMPVMNGDEATKHIRTFRPELPIIATTAFAQTGDEQRFREAGCTDYISKPIKKSELLRLLQENLK